VSDVGREFYDEVRQIKAMLMRDLGKWEGEADALLNGFLAKHAALLAERVRAQKPSMDMLLSDDVAIEGWRLGVQQSADLVYPEGAER
jgi:hypothetical protein